MLDLSIFGLLMLSNRFHASVRVLSLAAFICFSLLISTNDAFGQLWQDGFVVLNTGDTLTGKVKVATPAVRSVKVVFRDSATDEVTSYKPLSIKSFTANGETFDSKIYDVVPSFKYGYSVFMRRMNSGGPIKVYEYWNTDKERGFTQTFLENDGDYLFEVLYPRFKPLMITYFEEYPQLVAKIKRGAFKKRDLLKIVHEYNSYMTRGY